MALRECHNRVKINCLSSSHHIMLTFKKYKLSSVWEAELCHEKNIDSIIAQGGLGV